MPICRQCRRELKSLTSLGGTLAHYHVMRRKHADVVFFGGVPSNDPAIGGGLTITGPQPFSEMDPEALRAGARTMIDELEKARPNG